MANRKYDICLSFAGEDRAYVVAVAERLRQNGVSVFYDGYETANLWGKNLYDHLSSVYRDEAAYCVMFVSRAYAAKLWTSHERKSAQERAFRKSKEYILPIRFDDTAIPGLASTVGYVDARVHGPAEVAAFIAEKLRADQGYRTTASPTGELPASSMPSLHDNVMTALLSEQKMRILGAYEQLSPDMRAVAVAELRRRLDAESLGDRSAALAALFYLRDSNLKFDLMRLAEDTRPAVRRRALFYIGELKLTAALPIVSAAMSDANADVRAAARQAFGKIPGARREL